MNKQEQIIQEIFKDLSLHLESGYNELSQSWYSFISEDSFNKIKTKWEIISEGINDLEMLTTYKTRI